MITTLVLLPLVGILIILISNRVYGSLVNETSTLYMNIGLGFSIITFILSIIIWLSFDSSYEGYQFIAEYSSENMTLYHFYLGLDGLNLFFVLLTTFITPIALLSNYNTFKIKNNVMMYVICFLLLETLQLLTFVSLDLFMFYVFFESVLPILFIIIIVYGSGNKIRSAYLLFIYTLFGSLFMLLAILTIYNYASTTDFMTLSLRDISFESQKWLWLGFFLAFAVKTPLWPLASWLYRAHADSPLAGSMLLAGTILKLATYGFLRISISIFPDACYYFTPLVQTLAIVSLIYASLSTIICEDTKVMVAYSSIAHMSVCILGLFSNTLIGIEGAILLSIAHGFVSPALFLAVGGSLYERFHTRIIKKISGVVTYMPVFSVLFLIASLANAGIPLSLNFLGEQFALVGVWESNPMVAILGASGIFFSAVYSIFLFNRLTFGVYSMHNRQLYEPKLEDNKELELTVPKDLSSRELVLYMTLLIPTALLGIYPNVILDSLHISISQLIYIPFP